MTVDVKTGDITNNVKGDVTGPVTPTLIDALKVAQNAKTALPTDATPEQLQAAQVAIDEAQSY